MYLINDFINVSFFQNQLKNQIYENQKFMAEKICILEETEEKLAEKTERNEKARQTIQRLLKKLKEMQEEMDELQEKFKNSNGCENGNSQNGQDKELKQFKAKLSTMNNENLSLKESLKKITTHLHVNIN